MSQVSFDTNANGQKVVVTAGWDVPLQYFHMTITALDDNGDDMAIMWCNLHQKKAFPKTTEAYRATLDSLDITPPPNFWDIVHRQEGNVLTKFVPAGTNAPDGSVSQEDRWFSS